MVNFIKRYRNVILIILDVLLILAAYFLVYFFRNQSIFLLPPVELIYTLKTVFVAIIIYEFYMIIFGMYNNITRFESGKEYIQYACICVFSAVTLSVVPDALGINVHGLATNLLAGLIISVGMITYRLLIRLILTREIVFIFRDGDTRKKLLIIGAGDAGKEVITTVQKNLLREYKLIGVIDDNSFKQKHSIAGARILGGRDKIKEVCEREKIDEIFFAISNIDNKERKEILNICQNTGAKVKILPGIRDIIKGKKVLENLRDVEIEDLLGRDSIKLDNESIRPLIEDKVIMVTGAGGSIGSELCRQIMEYKPTTLVMVDVYENTLYDIEMELIRKYPDKNIKAVIASIRDKDRLNKVFGQYRPYLVFHAAAHKHVPLMEGSPLEAIKNNIFGTYNVINCADEYDVKRFILISTDKAVNPTNIMGATKRMCEMMLQAKNKVSETEYAAVRFGNVLGSNGSVIPLFKKQIQNGGPVTLTHENITRYFMTIPEAVSLVIQAMTFAEGGEIFVLDMGKPVRIYDLAKTLIRLSGYEPHVDMEIKITGLRPGEKLYEELLMDEEGLEKTKHEKIFIGEPKDITIDEIQQKLGLLKELTINEDVPVERIKEVMKVVVPTYKEAEK